MLVEQSHVQYFIVLRLLGSLRVCQALNVDDNWLLNQWFHTRVCFSNQVQVGVSVCANDHFMTCAMHKMGRKKPKTVYIRVVPGNNKL